MNTHEIVVELLQARSVMSMFMLGTDGIDKVLEHFQVDTSRLPKQGPGAITEIQNANYCQNVCNR